MHFHFDIKQWLLEWSLPLPKWADARGKISRCPQGISLPSCGAVGSKALGQVAPGRNTADHDAGHTQHRLRGVQLCHSWLWKPLSLEEVQPGCRVGAAVSHICCEVRVLVYLLAGLFLIGNPSFPRCQHVVERIPADACSGKEKEQVWVRAALALESPNPSLLLAPPVPQITQQLHTVGWAQQHCPQVSGDTRVRV